jgi:peptide/nickel transport system permease protein
MALFILRRLGAAAIVLFLGSVLVFLGVRALPGDPAVVLAGNEASPSAIAAIRHDYGLDRPLPVQYGRWAGKAITGDFGRSTQDLIPVGHILGERLPVTIELSLLAMIVAVGVGVTAGIVAGGARGRGGAPPPPPPSCCPPHITMWSSRCRRRSATSPTTTRP